MQPYFKAEKRPTWRRVAACLLAGFCGLQPGPVHASLIIGDSEPATLSLTNLPDAAIEDDLPLSLTTLHLVNEPLDIRKQGQAALDQVNRALDNQQPKEALRVLQSMLAKRPDHAALHVQIGRLHLRLNNTKQARLHARKALAIAPSEAAHMRLLGAVYVHEKDYEKALTWWQRANSADPRSVHSRRVTAQIYNEMHRPAKAAEAYVHAAQISAAPLNELSNACKILAEAENWPAMLPFQIRILGARRTNRSDWKRYIDGLLATRARQAAPPPTEQSALAHALQLSAAEKHAEALYVGLIYLRNHLNNSAAHNAVGGVLAAAGEVEFSLPFFQAAAEIDPNNKEAAENLKRVANAVRQLEHRRDLARAYAAVEAQPTDAETHFQVGAALAQQKRYEEAADSFRRAQKYQPNNLRHTIAQSRCLFLAGLPHRARLAFVPAFEASPGDPAIVHRMAFLILRDPETEAKDLNHAVELLDRLLSQPDQVTQEYRDTLTDLHKRLEKQR